MLSFVFCVDNVSIESTLDFCFCSTVCLCSLLSRLCGCTPHLLAEELDVEGAADEAEGAG